MSVILAQFLPYIIAAGAAVLAALGYGFQQRRAGAKAEQAKRAQERLQARTEADRIDDAVAGMSDAEVIRRQGQWSRGR